MRFASKILSIILALGFGFFLFACDDPQKGAKKSISTVVSGKISQPLVQNKLEKDELKVKNNQLPSEESRLQGLGPQKEKRESMHYDSQGKIDPFESLIQEKPVESLPMVDDRPKRILTPLEKVGLNQIRLVAVIMMKDRQIAMVEEASGKGYEVGIGTYIGKNKGKVSEIKDSSIVIKELVLDYKGRLKERVQEINLHKIDIED